MGRDVMAPKRGTGVERNIFASQDLSTAATFGKMDEGCLRALEPSLEVILVKKRDRYSSRRHGGPGGASI